MCPYDSECDQGDECLEHSWSGNNEGNQSWAKREDESAELPAG